MINLFSPLRTVLMYFLFGVVWILTTDSLLRWISENMPSFFWQSQKVKGIIFVTISASILYWLLQKYLKSLQSSEMAYMSIFKTSPNPMWLYDAETFHFIEVNDAAITTYGYSREEFRRMTILDIRPAEDIEKFMSGNHPAGSGFIPGTAWRHLKKDGSIIYVDIQAFHTEYKEKHVVVVSSRNITDKYLADQALSEQQQLLSTIINSTDDLIWAVDNNTRLVAFNNAFKNTIQQLTGIEAKPGVRVRDAEGEAEYKKWQQYYEDSLAGKKQILEEVREMDNGVVYAEITMDPIIVDDHVIGVACFAHNITKRKEQELALTKVLERYDIVNMATNDVIWDWDLVNNTVVWNQNMQLQFGYEEVPDEVGWWEQRIHPDDVDEVLKSLYERIASKLSAWKMEYRFRHHNGTYRHVKDRGFAMYNEEGKAVRMIGAIQDVEDKKQYIEELKKVAQLSSHSLRRPVASMLGIVDLLNKEDFAHPDNAPLLGLVEKVAHEMDSMLHVVAEKCNRIFRQTEEV
ncbi:PAS domain S-box protein [Chitinophaga lutea]|uniref:histidine kinase n=1 Tax=Chitinophaga lutea TaxID=2488634 RepID=A0A3N4PPL6_9BACT|nr:PAS domain S-box protein [Chitinophaga lutea]RPE08629.1 PAS domain S-box protein [Chitinophaga lutea]